MQSGTHLDANLAPGSSLSCQEHCGLTTRPRTSSLDVVDPAVPILHKPMHNGPGHEQLSLDFIPGVGLSDLECPEQVWPIIGHPRLEVLGPLAYNIVADEDTAYRSETESRSKNIPHDGIAKLLKSEDSAYRSPFSKFPIPVAQSSQIFNQHASSVNPAKNVCWPEQGLETQHRC